MSTIQVQATLSRQELLKATQQLDIAELAERIGYLVELAQLRNVSLTDLMDELGIQPLNHA